MYLMKMEAKLLSCESGSNISDEDFIDMEVSSFSTFFSASVASPPRNNRSEFEFKMETELTTSPADELFYKGKLLPLHLPPRLQMVEKLLQNSTYRSKDVDFDELYATPLTATLTTPTAAHTPYESCNISPFESRQASRELNAQEYFAEYYYPAGCDVKENYSSKKTWTQKLKIIKQSSRAYLKSFFGKSGCSNESSAAKVADEGSVSKNKAAAKTVLSQVHKQKNATDHVRAGLHRRSFSLAIRRNSVNKILSSSSSSVSSSSCSSSSSSSSVSNNADGSHRVQFLKRSGSVNSEMEKSIQGAIAHCKRSQQSFCPRKTVGEVGFYSSLSSSNAVGEGHERPEICRG